MPPAGFLFSIAGLGLSLAGFAGLVIAFHRGGPLSVMDTFRMRQLPEMALAASLLAILTIPLVDSIGSVSVALQVASGLGLLFTLGHVVHLLVRTRELGIGQSAGHQALITVVNLLVVGTGAAAVALGTSVLYEWLLVFMLARPMLAFAFVLSEVGAA